MSDCLWCANHSETGKTSPHTATIREGLAYHAPWRCLPRLSCSPGIAVWINFFLLTSNFVFLSLSRWEKCIYTAEIILTGWIQDTNHTYTLYCISALGFFTKKLEIFGYIIHDKFHRLSIQTSLWQRRREKYFWGIFLSDFIFHKLNGTSRSAAGVQETCTFSREQRWRQRLCQKETTSFAIKWKTNVNKNMEFRRNSFTTR